MLNYLFCILLIVVGTLLSCSKKDAGTSTSSVEDDDSASGAVVTSVGGALSQSNSSGGVAMFKKNIGIFGINPAFAASACPTLLTGAGLGCELSGSKVLLTYSGCSFGSRTATLTGVVEISTSNSTSLSCGTFPSNLADGIYLQRQFVSSAGVPGTGTRVNERGVSVIIDHQTTNLGNFDNVTIAANVGTGYGSQVQFDGTGKRKGLIVKQRTYVSGGFDHSIDGTLSLSDDGTSRTVSGTLKVYHNKVKVIGTTTFSSLVFSSQSCIPTSGSLSTVFSEGVNVASTAIGSRMIGKTESLSFIGNNQATYTGYDGSSKTVELTHCY